MVMNISCKFEKASYIFFYRGNGEISTHCSGVTKQNLGYNYFKNSLKKIKTDPGLTLTQGHLLVA